MVLSHFLYALLSGILPAILWLIFWLREDNLNPEPRSLVSRTFISGMAAVLVVLPLQYLAHEHIQILEHKYVIWAACEEILKFIAAYIIALQTKYMDEPIDALVYMITVALGFAALENTFFVFNSFLEGDFTRGLVTGNMRFIGATLLHVVSSATIGVSIAFSYYKDSFVKGISLATGIILAIALHSAFNLLIIKATTLDTLKVFGWVWVGVVVMMLLFEKIKTIRPQTA